MLTSECPHCGFVGIPHVVKLLADIGEEDRVKVLMNQRSTHVYIIDTALFCPKCNHPLD